MGDAHRQLIQLGTAFWVSRAVFAAAEIGIADHLDVPKTAAELAGPTQTHAPSLHRLMRALAGLGILVETEGRFALTPLGEAMRSGAEGSARAAIRTLGSEYTWRGWERIVHSVRTGESGAREASGMSIFDYLAQHPEKAAMFSETMRGFHGSEPPAVAEAYDVSSFGTIVDLGGATGTMLAALLARSPASRGVLFDLPHVVVGAPALLAELGVGDRVTIQSGSFFDGVPAGGDAYVLSHIIHDWSEEQCLTILRNCRAAMPPHARLLIIEMVIPDGNAPHPGKMLDLQMLVGPGGQERTEAEYRTLLRAAGFDLARVVPTRSAVSVVEAVPA